MDLDVLYEVSYGMYIIGVNDGKKPTGCLINTVTQITNENPTIAVSLSKDNYTFEILNKTKNFSISILSENIDKKIVGTFGFRSGKEINKFDNLEYEEISGLPIIKKNCCGNLICEVISMIDVNTHFIIVAKLIDTIKGEKENPMTYLYYRNVIKGKAPKNAPTYQEKHIK